MATSTDSPLPPAREIPTTFLASARSWWALGEESSAIAEERLLRRLPSFRSESDPDSPHDGPVIATRSRVAVSKPNHFLNILSMIATHPAPDAPPPVVLLPGYGGGIGVFFRNLPALAEWAGRRGSRAYAVDWLGMGRSARVPFIIKAARSDIPGRGREAEAFFIDSLEEWRLKMQLEQMTLIGHSLGAYFSVCYALKYPQRVNKLILLSPAGISPDPALPSVSAPDPTPTPSTTSSAPAEFSPKASQVDNEIRVRRVTAPLRESHSLLLWYLWEWGWTPFHIARCTLFWGPLLVGWYALTHFSGLTDEERRDLYDYILNITLAKGSGEYCIAHLIPLSSYARMPLIDRMAALKIPITFVYGDRDWMDAEGGAQCIENLRKAGNTEARSVIVENAGHQVYFDNPAAVNELVVRELDRRSAVE
ncbi:alpha/beta-hydrolase [Mycena crocata]|nr:alpha/beta-hydrolase [Mycena crocata]